MRLYLSGIKSFADAQKAVLMGASAIGMKIGYGKEEVNPEKARDIFFSLPVFISRVGIFADEKRYVVQELVTFCRLDTLHFVGNEQPKDLERYPEHVMKTFSQSNHSEIANFTLQAAVINIDTDMEITSASEIFQSKSLILFGQLTLSEWTEVVKKHRPYALQLDISCDHKDMIGDLLSL